MITFYVILLFLIFFVTYNKYESFSNPKSDYPCRVFLSDKDFLKHMITHHQMAIDISIQHIKNTQNDRIMNVCRELIKTQEYQIFMMNVELNNPIVNVSEIEKHQPFVPTISSTMYPNVIGLTTTYCDPSFFTSNNHSHMKMIMTDRQYIQHMIPHHQVAIDMSKILLKHTISDFLTDLSYRMIRDQEYEIILLNDLAKSRLIK